MSPETWSTVDHYFNDLIVRPDEALTAALASSEAAGLPAISVSAAQGKLLHMLARSIRATRILEVGTLGGYSTIWMARALPTDGTGKVITLEIDPKHADIARANFKCANVDTLVEVRVGRAIELLPRLVEENVAPFDLIFIDADKQSNADYFRFALKLARVGSLIIVDNVVRNGAVADPASKDASVQGVRRFNEALAAETRVIATALQTVGSKGYDGFAMALVVS